MGAQPLSGLKVLEFAGLAPAPYAGMVLADFGADVIRLDKPNGGHSEDILARGKRSACISAKTDAGRKLILKLIARSDVLIDPFRPGVLEKLGFEPDEMLRHNPRLVYARMYGYEKDSKYADMAGHDIGYSALSGVLSMIRPDGQKPSLPLNILADFAGGGIMCAMGILMALMERVRSGKGQVVNTDMVSGLRYIASFSLILKAASENMWDKKARLLVLDGSLPYYSVYETKEGRYITLGALENRFYATFLKHLKSALSLRPVQGKNGKLLLEQMPTATDQYDSSTWPALRAFLTEAFASRTRDEWEQVFLDTDSCVAPVLDPEEAVRSRGTPIPKPAPQLVRTPATLPSKDLTRQLVASGQDTMSILSELGVSEEESHRLQAAGDVQQHGRRVGASISASRL